MGLFFLSSACFIFTSTNIRKSNESHKYEWEMLTWENVMEPKMKILIWKLYKFNYKKVKN